MDQELLDLERRIGRNLAEEEKQLLKDTIEKSIELYEAIKQLMQPVVESISKVAEELNRLLDDSIEKENRPIHNTPYKPKIKHWILQNKPRYSYIRNRL